MVLIQYYGNFVKERYLLTILHFALQSLTTHLRLSFATGTSKMAVRTCQRIKIGSRGFPLQGCFRRYEATRMSDKNTSCSSYSKTN